MSDERMVPAALSEQAIAYDVMRALVATLLANRKSQRVRVTYAQRERAFGVLVRIVMRGDGSIEAWLDEPRPDMRLGVAYVPDTEPTP